jgi:hypothetical protein
MASKCCKKTSVTLGNGDLTAYINMIHRTLMSAEPGLAEPEHTYDTLWSTKANIKTKGGSSQFSRVEIDGTKVSHVVTIKYTSLEIDIRNRIRDGKGTLYSILAVENVDEANQWIRMYCAVAGAEDRKSIL